MTGFDLFLLITCGLLVISGHMAQKRIESGRHGAKWKAQRKAKSLQVRIVQGPPHQWCSLYIGQQLRVKPVFNSAGQEVDSHYTIIPCRQNKKALGPRVYAATRYSNVYGITLSIRKENVITITQE